MYFGPSGRGCDRHRVIDTQEFLNYVNARLLSERTDVMFTIWIRSRR